MTGGVWSCSGEKTTVMNLSSTKVQGKVQAQKISVIPTTPSHIFYNPDKPDDSLLFRQKMFSSFEHMLLFFSSHPCLLDSYTYFKAYVKFLCH